MTVSNRDVAIAFIEAMGRCDAKAAGDLFAADATCALMRWPYDHVEDREAFLNTIAVTESMVPGGIKPTVTNVIVDGDQVVVECQGHGVTTRGRPYDNRYCWVLRLQNGKIKTINQYLCTQLAMDTFAPV